MQLTRKSTLVTRYASLQDMPNFLFISMTGPKVVLQPLGWRCVECAIQRERDVREE